jgi:hypothetical protein
VSNEVAIETVEPAPPDATDRAEGAEVQPPPRLVLIAGDDDLVCVDDTCLPAGAER